MMDRHVPITDKDERAIIHSYPCPYREALLPDVLVVLKVVSNDIGYRMRHELEHLGLYLFR